MENQMTFPMVLAHGIARFDVLIRSDNDMSTDHRNYWKNIRTILKENKYISYHTNVDWAGSVNKRAAELADQVKTYISDNEYSKVNIVAHSMGGIDARVAIAKFGLAHYVASLTTLHTPHHGTTFADWGFETGVAKLFTRLLKLLGIDAEGFSDLTTTACAKRNRELEDFEKENAYKIKYFTYAGCQSADDIFLPLVPSFKIIKKREGRNDGLVSVESAKWKKEFFCGIDNFDHLNVLGWWNISENDCIFGGRNKQAFEEEIKYFYSALANRLP